MKRNKKKRGRRKKKKKGRLANRERFIHINDFRFMERDHPICYRKFSLNPSPNIFNLI